MLSTMDGWMYSKDEVNDCMWPLQYGVILKRLTIQMHLTLNSPNTLAQII